MIKAVQLRCEHRQDPVCIGSDHPFLQWNLTAPGYGNVQSAAQVQVSREEGNWSDAVIWDSERIPGSFTGMVYAGPHIHTDEKVFWRVRVWDESDTCGEWSEAGSWCRGIEAEDWQA